MKPDTRTVIAASIISVVAFGLLGAVFFEAATSMGVVHKHNLLLSALETISATHDAPDDLRADMTGHQILTTGGLAAAIIGDDGMVEFLGGGDARAQLLYVANHIRDNPRLEPHQVSLDVEGVNYVWASLDAPDLGGRLVLINETPPSAMPDISKLLVVPVVISILIVAWLFVWFILIARQVIRAKERNSDLELELVRQEEASRITAAFLANMSHELRTPLNAIIGFAEMMRQEIFGPLGNARYRDYANDIAKSGGHLVNMVGNILDISKIESGEETLEEEKFSLPEAARECLRIIDWETVGKDHTLQLELSSDSYLLFADRGKVRQVLINLITNARKFTPKGGTITVRSEVLDDGRLTLEVEDTGKGIAPEDIELVMRPFGRAQSEPGHSKDGTGLGLPLSRSLVHLHGGTFDLWSMVGVGTTVRMVFPGERTVTRRPKIVHDTGAEKERSVA